MSEPNNPDNGDFRPRGPGDSELRRAAERLEAAVEDLVRATGGAVGDRAARVIDDIEGVTRRLRDQISSDDRGAPGPRRSAAGTRARGAAGGEPIRATRANGYLRNLYRDRERGWFAGVCAGLARYFGTEPWVMRILAVILFMTPFSSFVLFGYIAAIFLLAPLDRARAGGPHLKGREHEGSLAPEFGPRLAPRPTLRAVRIEFMDIEKRLQRMEEFVTSSEMTLRQELDALESRGDSASSGNG